MAFGAPHAARAQAGPSAVVPYDENLLRLAEVLGSVHYLRNVCGEESNSWRERMEELLVVENPEPLRRARLVASFNRGYRTFDSVYTKCTRQALDAVERYMREGLELTREINSRYGE
nr:TIGR02301 family protein [Oricola cellulosilytica]